jgi:ribonuclease PH
MIIEAVKCTIHSGRAAHAPGDPFEIDDKRGEYLVEKGLARVSTGKPAATETPDKKRDKLISAALKKEIGTVEDLEKLTNEEIQELLKKGDQ